MIYFLMGYYTLILIGVILLIYALSDEERFENSYYTEGVLAAYGVIMVMYTVFLTTLIFGG